MGALPERAGLGDRARRLQRGRHCLGVLSPRPRPVPRLPLERGRLGGDQRRASDAVLRPGLVERPGPHPEGADLRPHRQPGNHGEDAKEYWWWYLDSTPTHSFMKWRYLYPQREFPTPTWWRRTGVAAARIR